MGKRAVEMIVKDSVGMSHEALSIVLPTIVIERKSC